MPEEQNVDCWAGDKHQFSVVQEVERHLERNNRIRGVGVKSRGKYKKSKWLPA